MENVQSGRSTPTLLAFTEEARLMGAEALSRASGKADALVPFALRLLGRLYNATDVHTRLSQEFSPMELLETPNRLSFSVRVRGEVYTVEELLSMIFEMARKMSDSFGRTQVRDCVVTVPSSFTRSQRILIMQTAQAAGLNVLSLLHENAAAALYYGIDRQDNDTAHYALFYNLGASRVQVSVVKYTASERPVAGAGNKIIEHTEVLSHTYNDQLGGRTFDAMLASHIADEFERLHSVDPRSSKKTMLRVMNHANKVKKVLSANKVAFVHDDSLYQGKALSYGVQREVLEAMVTAKAQDLLRPVDEALRLANLTIDNINSFEIIGGVSRIPKVQELLKTYNGGRDLGLHLNGDEAMAHGAALYAANFSHELHVKPMWLSDVVPYSIRAEFWSPDDPSFAKNGTVFNVGTRVSSKKQLTVRFSKRTVCRLVAKYPDHESIMDEYGVADIPEVAANFSQTPLNVFTFALDPSGIPFLWMVHSEVEVAVKRESPLDENSTEALKETSESSNPPQTRTEKLKLKFAPFSMELPPALTKSEAEAIAAKLVDFTKHEKERQKLSEAKSELEGYVYYLREKLEEETFRLVTTESERMELASLLQTEGSWLESADFLTATSEDLLKRKGAIRSTVFDALDREEEMGKRPAAVEDMLKRSDKLNETATSYNLTMPWVPAEMFEEVFKALQEAREWLNIKLQEQESRQPWESPAFRVAELPWKLESIKILLDTVKRLPKPKSPVSSTQKKSRKPKAEDSSGQAEDPSPKAEGLPTEAEDQSTKPSEAQDKEQNVPEPIEDSEEPLELPAYADL